MRTTPDVCVAAPYDETAMKSNSSGRRMYRARSAMTTNAPFRTPTSKSLRPA